MLLKNKVLVPDLNRIKLWVTSWTLTRILSEGTLEYICQVAMDLAS